MFGLSPTQITNITTLVVVIASVVLNHYGIMPMEVMTFILGAAGYQSVSSAGKTQTLQTLTSSILPKSSTPTTETKPGEEVK
jgi:hypothetical protein